jgi:hypothetical protein
MDLSADTAFRRGVLASCGASPEVADELLSHPCATGAALPDTLPTVPLGDELHIEAWTDYAADARRVGALAALRDRLVQLRFPIRAGISQHTAYLAATRRGETSEAEAFAPGLAIHDPGGLALEVRPTWGGRVPILVAADRRDFVSLVQAFTGRNEPAHVPDAVGACMVSGLNNWDRIARYRAAWERAHEGSASAGMWPVEFGRLRARPGLYQDRFILLSRGAYSGVPASALGLDDDEWLARSLVIRREHECEHYGIVRLTGRVPHRVLDELVADCVGIIHAFGAYDPELALRCLGLERAPAIRAGGRLEAYRGTPPLSDAAFTVLAEVCRLAVGQLEERSRTWLAPPAGMERLPRFVYETSRLSLEHLASGWQPGTAGAA